MNHNPGLAGRRDFCKRTVCLGGGLVISGLSLFSIACETDDTSYAKHNLPITYVYWSEKRLNTIQRAHIESKEIEEVISGLDEPKKLFIDRISNKLYWHNKIPNQLKRANLDGSNIETVYQSSTELIIRDFSIHNQEESIYCLLADPGPKKSIIRKLSLNGDHITDIVPIDDTCTAFSINLNDNKVYWASLSNDKIQFIDLDGDTIKTLISSIDYIIMAVVENTKTKEIFCVDIKHGDILCLNLATKSITPIFTRETDSSFGISIDSLNNKIYWPEQKSQKIFRANCDGTGLEELLTGLDTPYGIALA